MRDTEESSKYNDLENFPISELLSTINAEDKTVPLAVEKAIPNITRLVEKAVAVLKAGNKVFYIGAGTSGRLGILDASELPPTFGAEPQWVSGLIAGGDNAIRNAVEFAEDDESAALGDLNAAGLKKGDLVIGIAASGTTPYVIGGLRQCRENEVFTGCLTCNSNAPLLQHADFPVLVVTGPEVVTGSTRMKAGTAQKLVLNMFSTSVMIKLGRVKGNKMVDMQLSNNKLVDRGTRMLMEELNLGQQEALKLLKKHGSVRAAIINYQT